MSTPRQPPRDLPITLQVLCLFGSIPSVVGWSLIGFGMIFVRIFAGDITPAELLRWRGELVTVPGEITGAEYTNARENEVLVQAVHFRYTAASQSYQGVSYVTREDQIPPGPTVLEHPAGDPEHARVLGMRATWFSPWALFVWIFPAIGGGMALYGTLRGLRERELLIHGQVAEAELLRMEPTNTRINGKRVFQYTYQFEGPMGPQQVVARTHQTRRLGDEERERILFDPGHPERALVLDAAAGSPVVLPDGQLAAHRPYHAALVMLAPGLSAALHLIWTLLQRGSL